jgi:cytochrome c
MPARSTAAIAKFAALALVLIGLAIVAVRWTSTPDAPEPPLTGAAADPSNVQFYQRRVQPILRSNCYRCHAGFLPKGGLRLDSEAGIVRGGKHGSVLTPGHPETSRLIISMRHEGSTDGTKPMPPKSKLSDADIAAITAWVKAGAPMSKDSQQ